VDGWFSEIGKFISDVGTIPANPEARNYITDEFMKKVAADPKLKAFATEFDKK
jgi:NitT/TauT family transport system substrate-binding protein